MVTQVKSSLFYETKGEISPRPPGYPEGWPVIKHIVGVSL